MNSLFTLDTQDFRKYVSVNRNYSMQDLLPTLDQTAQTQLPRFLGDTLAEQLAGLGEQISGQQTESSPILTSAFTLTCSFVAKLGFAAHAPFAEVQIDNDGITVSASQDRKPAFQYQTNELRRQLSEMAWQALDQLLKLISKNAELFPGWQASPYYQDYKSDLFASPAEFSRFYPIQDRWLTYWALVPAIRIIEDRLGADQLARIDALPDSVTAPVRAKLTRQLKQALAYEVILQAIPSLSIDIAGANVQVNYGSQYGNATYFTPPSREQLDWTAENLKKQLVLFWDTYENAISPLIPIETPTNDDSFTGLPDQEGPFVMI